MFCKHKWKILSEQTTDSKFETAMSTLQASGRHGKVNVPWQMANVDRKVIQIVTCEKCGNIKKFVTNI